MTQNIVISKLEHLKAKNGKPYISIHDQSGEKYSVWPNLENKQLFETASMLRVGQQVSIGFDTNGNFKNVNMVVPSESFSGEYHAPPLQNTTGSSRPVFSPPFNDKKDKRISRLACINSSIAFFEMLGHYGVKEIPNASKILDNAEEFEKWVYRGVEE